MQVSHSKIETFKLCPKKYDLRYNHRIVPKKYFSALMFGIAIDDAINLILLQKLVNPTEKQKTRLAKLKRDKEYPYRLFDNVFAFQKPFENTLNDTGTKVDSIDVRKDWRCEYFPSDFDGDLLEAEDLKVLKKYIKSAGYAEKDPITLWNLLNNEIKSKKKLDLIGKEFYNYCCFLSLRRKARVLLDLFTNEVLPKIKEVHSLQERVSLVNEDGDTLIGFIDITGILEGEDFVRVIDIKTSGARYALNSVKESQQLGIYTEYKNTDKGAYIVLLKKPKITEIYKCFSDDCINGDVGDEFKGKRRKKCPECKEELFLDRIEKDYEYQIVVDEISDETKDLLFDEISDIVEEMESEVYEEDRGNCFHFGKKCDYYDLCRTGSMEDLLNKGKRK